MSGELKASRPATCCGAPPCSHDFCKDCLEPVCEGQGHKCEPKCEGCDKRGGVGVTGFCSTCAIGKFL